MTRADRRVFRVLTAFGNVQLLQQSANASINHSTRLCSRRPGCRRGTTRTLARSSKPSGPLRTSCARLQRLTRCFLDALIGLEDCVLPSATSSRPKDSNDRQFTNSVHREERAMSEPKKRRVESDNCEVPPHFACPEGLEVLEAVRVVCRKHPRVLALPHVVWLIDSFVDCCSGWTLPKAVKTRNSRLTARVMRCADHSVALSNENKFGRYERAANYAAGMGGAADFAAIAWVAATDADELCGHSCRLER
ncbi:unnamed protein product [Phytophthora lilii]|uniref:Unnamed protein product n=1 Tax=Phytophthora lilii TaxID=2077276 RepID=A0A9W6TQU1_9STRA|nr:unnamed protein product [Phytophthora lilii]